MSEKKTSFEASRFSGFKFDPNDLIVVGLDTKDGSEHPLWDERILLHIDESMVLSIMAIGVQVPVKVMKVGEKAYVIDGRRRVIHAREANKRLQKQGEPLVIVPCVVEKGSEEHMAHVSVALNEIRRQDDVLVKATKAMRMISRGHEMADVAIAFGVTQTAIKNWMKLVELPSPVKKAVSDGVLSAHAASQLHGLERTEQLQKLEELKTEHASTGKRATGRATAKKAGKKTKKPSKKDLLVVVDKLSHSNDAWLSGVCMGIRFALGEKVPEVTGAVKESK